MATWKTKSERITLSLFQKRGRRARTCWRVLRLPTCQPAFQKTPRGWATAPEGELGQRRGRRQDSAESPPHPAETQKHVLQLQTHQRSQHLKTLLRVFVYMCMRVPTAGRLCRLTEELFVLVRGNVMRWDELTKEGQVSCAVIFACTFFWRSVLTSKTASILQEEEKNLVTLCK